jgi:CBS domain-containing protein
MVERELTSVPVVDEAGRLVGMLARKDFIAACPLQIPS